MADSFSRQHRSFIVHYCVHFNATRAAKDANYKCASDNAYSHRGLELLRNVHIKDEINRICAEQDEATLATKSFIINKIKEVLEADIVEYIALGKRGASKSDLSKMPKEIRKMITQVERKDFYIYDNGKRVLDHSTYKFKLMSKDKMAELLAKHTGAVKEGPLVENNNINQMGYNQLLEKAESEEAKKNGG